MKIINAKRIGASSQQVMPSRNNTGSARSDFGLTAASFRGERTT